MLAQVTSGAVLGVDAYLVRVEVDVVAGLPGFHVVGLAENAVREGRERVLTAVRNQGVKIPPRRVTANLAPADVPKSGSSFDLPLALGMLRALGELGECDELQSMCILGELGLDGSIRPVRGVLPIAARSRAAGLRAVMCPEPNAAEAAVVDGIDVYGVRHLRDAIDHLRGEVLLMPYPRGSLPPTEHRSNDLDFADVKGQESVKRALEVAAAGTHNVVLKGPPGVGKSMLARRVSGIMPPLCIDEAIEVTKVYSVAGGLRPGQALVRERPFRAPHHSVSDVGLVGGGNPPRPGEVSLAHTGVLFLDEFPEFRRGALESLRQPLEDGVLQLVRARVSITYPARFMLIAAMNPCPCGYRGTNGNRCVCTQAQVERYAGRLSGPLLDRIDIQIEVPAIGPDRLSDCGSGESSAVVRERVLAARERQAARFVGTRMRSNEEMGPRELRAYCRIDAAGERLLRAAVTRLGLSARAYHRVLRVARTIADLAGAERIAVAHLAEAVQYRSLDRQPVLR